MGGRMRGLLEFMAQFGTEDRCIVHLAGLRWPGGYVCASCGGPEAWRLKERPRIYECRGCGYQESVTAGTIFHRTRTDLPKWFLAAYLMGKDKRGVSAKFLQRELDVAYQTAWTIAHKLRHGLSEDPTWPIGGYPEAAETFTRAALAAANARGPVVGNLVVALRREGAPGFNVRQNVRPILLRLFKQSRLRASPVPPGLPPL